MIAERVGASPLVLDSAAAHRAVSDEEFRLWAADHSVFLSSVMGELAAERRLLASALESAGLTVRWFEELGGRDDSAQQAYLSEVAGTDIYVGMLGDEYGGMLPDGFSATHAEYLEARRHGKRVSFWARREASERAGHARNFLNEVQVFNVTGSFVGRDDLPERLLRRLREMAAEDLSPWVKIGRVVFRAERIHDSGHGLRARARIRDGAVLQALDALRGNPSRGRVDQVAVSYGDRSGRGSVEDVIVETSTQAYRDVELEASVEWVRDGDPMAAGAAGYTAEELSEVGLRAGLLGEEVPAELRQALLMGAKLDTSDPLDGLQRLNVPEGSVQSIARVLVVEALVGTGRASFVERFALGPAVGARRRLELEWRDAKRYANSDPELRSVAGSRPWG